VSSRSKRRANACHSTVISPGPAREAEAHSHSGFSSR
jgi:hypothetical protein